MEDIQMDKLKPKLFSLFKTYSKEQFVKDVISGIIVAIIALPLSIALALASGVNPERGLYTAIIAGFIISFLGGSRVQIAGPTAAFATIVAGIVAEKGMDGLIIATIMAGIILILMGLLRLGNLIRFIPYTITTGFTAGIAVTIVIGQIKDFLGMNFPNSPIETLDKIEAIITNFTTMNIQALIVGLVSLLILIFWPKINAQIPGSLIAIAIAILMVKVFKLEVNTIGSLYDISPKLPTLSLPNVDFNMVQSLIPDAFTIAILAAIESLLSCVVADGMIGSKHRSNMELIAQGTGNIFSVLFGGVPATGAIARTAANIKNGGRTPIAGMVHSITLLLILVILMPYAAFIPMSTIAAILFIVAYNMSGWREFFTLVKFSPKSDIIILITTFLLTIIFDLVVAIGIGLILAATLFMKRMADVTSVKEWEYLDENELEQDSENISFKVVPKNTLVFEINGPMFFGAANKFIDVTEMIHQKKTKNLIIRMRSVPTIDATALHSLHSIIRICKKEKITLILSHVQEQPLSVIKKAGLYEKIGSENFCKSIDDALAHAKSLLNN